MVAYTDPELFVPGSDQISHAAQRRLRVLAKQLSAIEGVQAKSTQDLASAMEQKEVRVDRAVRHFAEKRNFAAPQCALFFGPRNFARAR